jgi:hypothetical protein
MTKILILPPKGVTKAQPDQVGLLKNLERGSDLSANLVSVMAAHCHHRAHHHRHQAGHGELLFDLWMWIAHLICPIR